MQTWRYTVCDVRDVVHRRRLEAEGWTSAGSGGLDDGSEVAIFKKPVSTRHINLTDRVIGILRAGAVS